MTIAGDYLDINKLGQNYLRTTYQSEAQTTIEIIHIYTQIRGFEFRAEDTLD